MLQLSAALANRPVMSLRTGGEIATAVEPIINPNNLKIEAWWCIDKFTKEQLILLNQDVRDIIKQGIVVNDHDVLTDPNELIRLQEVLKLEWSLLDAPVVTTDKHKLGKVSDYAADMPTLYIQKLYVTQPLIKSLSGGGLSIDRNQIVEITNRRIIVNNPLQPTKTRIAASPAPT